MDNDKICELLDEISLYFYQCYRNAGGGTRACEKFHDYMCAVDEAKALLKEQEAVTPIKARQGRNEYYSYFLCPVCKNDIMFHQSYCEDCGRKMKWDED